MCVQSVTKIGVRHMFHHIMLPLAANLELQEERVRFVYIGFVVVLASATPMGCEGIGARQGSSDDIPPEITTHRVEFSKISEEKCAALQSTMQARGAAQSSPVL